MNTFLKVGLTSLLVALAQAAHAEPYLGANIGGSMVTINKTLTYGVSTAKLSDKFSGFRGQLFAGWNIHLQREMDPDADTNALDELYFAFEVDGNYISSNASTTVTPWFLTYSISTQAQMRGSYDLLLLGKYKLAPNIVLFLGPGFSQGSFKVKTSSTTAGNMGVTKNGSAWLTGWTVKTGLEMILSTDLTVAVTYQYNNFESNTWTTTEPLTGGTVTGKYQPIINSVMVGAIWCIAT